MNKHLQAFIAFSGFGAVIAALTFAPELTLILMFSGIILFLSYMITGGLD